MRREIREDCPAVVEPVNTENMGNIKDWLQAQATTYKLRWLLAHADDGVIWGEQRNGQLVTSDSIAPDASPPLRIKTLQQARLFSAEAELLLWRDGDNQCHARLIRQPADEEKPTFMEAIDEPQMLWGTYRRDDKQSREGFTVVYEGQGLQHAVPIEVNDGLFGKASDERKRRRPLRLCVRHYLSEDDNGFAHIVASRLVDLKAEDGEEEEVAK
jgi:CRISPR-associated protein (TIGR03984 family)